MNRTHYGQHDDCFGCKVKTVQLAGSVEAQDTARADRKLRKDLDAYWRMRHNGLQPKHTADCAELEQRAHTQWEIDNHHIVEPHVWKQYGSMVEEIQTGMQEAQNMGVTAQQVKEWRDNPS